MSRFLCWLLHSYYRVWIYTESNGKTEHMIWCKRCGRFRK